MTKEAFEEKVMAMQDTLHRVSYSMLGNPHDQADAVQECIARAFAGRERLREMAYFETWVVRILINVCRDIMKRRTREMPQEIIEVVAPPASDVDMVEALSKLEEKHRVALVLHHIEGYTTKEIAQILHVPEGTVKYRLVRGRMLLQEKLTQGGMQHETAR